MNDTRRVLSAARPPEGLGPTTLSVLRGLRVLRPPVPVLLATLLMLLPPLALVLVAARYAVQIAGNGWPLLGKLVGGLLLCGTLYVLAALAYRGIKRVVHLGAYSEGFFLARLLAIGCTITGLFLVKYVLVDGEPTDPTMVVPFVALVIAWAPWPLLLLPSAQAWPERVRLRWSRPARDSSEAFLLFYLSGHRCPLGVPPWTYAIDEITSATGPGWRVHGACPRCGTALSATFGTALIPAEGVGGGDLHTLAQHLSPGPGETPQDVVRLDDHQLDLVRFRSGEGVVVHERLLALVPEGKDKVPSRRRTGTPLPLMTPETAFERGTLEQRLELHRGFLAAAEAEWVRRRPTGKSD